MYIVDCFIIYTFEHNAFDVIQWLSAIDEALTLVVFVCKDCDMCCPM